MEKKVNTSMHSLFFIILAFCMSFYLNANVLLEEETTNSSDSNDLNMFEGKNTEEKEEIVKDITKEKTKDSFTHLLSEEEERLVKQAFGLGADRNPHDIGRKRQENCNFILVKLEKNLEATKNVQLALNIVDKALQGAIPELKTQKGKTYIIYMKVRNVTFTVLDGLIKYSEAARAIRYSDQAVTQLAALNKKGVKLTPDQAEKKGRYKALILSDEKKNELKEIQGTLKVKIVEQLGSLLDLL